MLQSTSISGYVLVQLFVSGRGISWYVGLIHTCALSYKIRFFSACLPHYTSGQTYFYPAFNAARSEDALKFAHEFGEVLAMPIMLEAVMRVRASRGKLPRIPAEILIEV